MSAIITFKPKQITKQLLIILSPRAREVVINRYGLGKSTGKMTLEAIGNQYGITRERVRQIENAALGSIRKSDAFTGEKNALNELVLAIDSLGGIVSEEELLELISKDKNIQNHALLLLVLGDEFNKKKEDDEYKSHWYVNSDTEEFVNKALKNIYKGLSYNDLVSEQDLLNKFLNEIKDLNEKYRNEDNAKRWLMISKMLGKNPLGEWGLADSSNVKVKGMRDYAYLAIKKHGSPMHFTEVSKAIVDFFAKKAHTATCHNELIKDPRFVLVGRGLYALSEWGYTSGVVKDVISEILKKNGPLTREDIIDKVRKERYIKDNTIIVNLQNRDYFKVNKNGEYSLAK
ncbi:MAG: sigma factor-like helix-turn-helix DNA-binding protein [Patescibacteria group bacterium]